MIALNFKYGKSFVGKIIWTIALIFFQPLSGAVFFAVKQKSAVPLGLIVAAIALRIVDFAVSAASVDVH